MYLLNWEVSYTGNFDTETDCQFKWQGSHCFWKFSKRRTNDRRISIYVEIITECCDFIKNALKNAKNCLQILIVPALCPSILDLLHFMSGVRVTA